MFELSQRNSFWFNFFNLERTIQKSSLIETCYGYIALFLLLEITKTIKHTAGWRSWSSQQPHKLKVVGSNPTPATRFLLPWDSLTLRASCKAGVLRLCCAVSGDYLAPVLFCQAKNINSDVLIPLERYLDL